MADLLYLWPAAAEFGSRVPEGKFFDHPAFTPAVREKFASEVQCVTWCYKLAEATLDLRGTADVPEVQVLRIDARDADVSKQVLTAIDKAIPFPIVFEIARSPGERREVRMAAAHKRLEARTAKISRYFTTGWQPDDAPRQPLPEAATLPCLYAAILESLAQVKIRPGEDVSEITARLKQAGRLEREIAMLERKAGRERQFNRKVELYRTIRAKREELAEFIGENANAEVRRSYA